MPKSKTSDQVIIPVKIETRIKIDQKKLASLKEAIENDLWFSLVFEITNGRNQFIVRKEDYEGKIITTLGKDEAIFSFDCLVMHKHDRWMKKYQAKAPFKILLEGVYNANGDLHRFGDPDEDGFCSGVEIGILNIFV